MDARTEHHDNRILGRFRSRLDQGQSQRLCERGGRPGPDPFIDVRIRPSHQPTVGQRVPGSGGACVQSALTRNRPSAPRLTSQASMNS